MIKYNTRMLELRCKQKTLLADPLRHSVDRVCGLQMLFVPDEDYVRLPDYTSTADAAAAVATDDNDADDGNEEKNDDESSVSISILFASQAKYLGHSNQVSFDRLNSFCRKFVNNSFANNCV